MQQNGRVIHVDSRVSQMDFVPGVLLVKFKDQVAAHSTIANGFKKLGVTSVDVLLEKYQAKNVAKLFPTAQPLIQKKLLKTHTGQTIEQPNLHNIYKIELTDGTKIYDAMEAFKQDINVEFAEPNFIYSIVVDKPVSGVLTEREAKKISRPITKNSQTTVTPNDPLYTQQWYIPAIQADAVWDTTTGDTSQVIAFLDTGVDWHHPDLADNIWTNTAEADGVAGVDDDGNGFVDDVHGWDFINNDNDPSDDNSHGTHVAGIACAEGNNGIGIAGVDWHAKIMPIKVFQSNGQGDAATISQGINYAASNGATVINMSFGSYARSLTMEAALQNAYANCVLVAAAGNDASDINANPPGPFFPAALSYVLGVQATEQGGGLADYSNVDGDGPVYSQYPDLLNYEMKAPGTSIISTVPNGGYRVYSGTSMATPVVSGAVALYKTLHPNDSQELMWGNLINSTSSTLNIYSALQITVNPVLWFVSNTMVDTLVGDNKNGLVDAGETIQLWFTVRNTWGQSDSVFVGLRLGEFEDTSVAHVLNSTAFIGSISPYAQRTNQKNPFAIRISPNVAHDRNIVFEALLWYAGCTDTVSQQVVLTANNGQNLPGGIIDSIIVLTPNRQWLVNQPLKFTVNGGLIILPGTKVKFTQSLSGVLSASGTKDSVIELVGNGTGSIAGTYFKYCNLSHFIGVTGNLVNCNLDQIIGNSNYSVAVTGSLQWCKITNSWANSYFLNCDSVTNSIIMNCSSTNNPMEGMVVFERNNLVNWYRSWLGCGLPSIMRYNNVIKVSAVGSAPSMPDGYGGFFQVGGITTTQKYNNIFNCNNVFKSPIGNEIIPIDSIYWGSLDSAMMHANVFDVWNDIELSMFDFQNFLTAPTDSAHAIVWKVLVDGIDPQDQKKLMNPIGIGAHRFDVYFNRPMDITSTPQLSFGVRDPFNQQAVTDSARWSPDHRIWTAYKTIKLYTGDGINTISVAGAKDPEGFEIPVENMRFNFLIDAAGTSSLDFVATPGLGKINLEWNNTGLVDFLGFNMYRFINLTDTTYTTPTLINTKLITDTLYTDFNVVPGKKYYYEYTVVRTDFNESSYSHVAGTTALTSSPGDANGDLSVNVLDIVSVVSYILGENPQPFIFAAADINNDSTINVLDVVGIVNIILHPQSKNVLNKAKIALNQTTTGSAHLDLTGGTISLTSNVPVAAIQFKMVGSGLKNIQFTPGAALAQFEVASSALGDTARTFIIYNMKGLTLPQGTNTLGTFVPTPTQATIMNAIIADAQGTNIITNVFENGKPLIPTVYSLEQNFPNPFNPSTRIQYAIPEIARVKIVIYNLLGQKVRTFDFGQQSPGRYTITWDGRTQNGTIVSSGVYFYRFETQKFKQTKKLLMLK